jgi:maleylpyruvate isomerase
VTDRPSTEIELLASSHRRLAVHLLAIDPGVDPARPSLLPGWTLGHLLTHIARNGDSILRMAAGLRQYWGGFESRNADIELGSRRPWSELVDDVVSVSDAIDRRLAEIGDWSGSVQTSTVERPKAMLPELRRREVEIHRRDLGLGYEFADMPADFVRHHMRALEMTWAARMPMGMTTLPAQVLALPEHERFAWFTGRLDVPGVEPAGVF